MITRYFGMHKIKYNKEGAGIQRIYFIIMANVFNTTKTIETRYDLKGSKYGRNTKKSPEDVVEPGIALKDLDFDADKMQISVDADVKEALLKQIKMDVALF